jgi:hypothetical protein
VFSSFFLPSDGELYAGTVSNFQGNEPVIYKSLGHGTALKTENSLNWLQGEINLAFRWPTVSMFYDILAPSPSMDKMRSESQWSLLSRNL